MAQSHLNMSFGGGSSTSGKVVVSYTPWVTANGVGAYIEFGHTDVIKITPSVTKVKFDSQQSKGPLIQATQEVGYSIEIPALENRVDLEKVAMDQADANVTGETMLVGDPSDREWTIKIESQGVSTARNLIRTFHRCVRENVGAIELGKAILSKLVMTFAVLGDDSSTLGRYYRRTAS